MKSQTWNSGKPEKNMIKIWRSFYFQERHSLIWLHTDLMFPYITNVFIPLCCFSFSFKHLKFAIFLLRFFFLCAFENVHKNKWVETQMYFPHLLFFCFRSTFTSFLSNKLLCRGLWLRCLRYSSSRILGFAPSLHSLAATDGRRSLSTVLITLGFAIRYFLDKKTITFREGLKE